ncbi:hypothetical protein POTOM_053714 [Populus tomentosa]|uniref:COP9 signalosome complex subunit 3 N-terminal helical repeats domain-containing protein n=1 Tax=Populus tomentosa TaxID=118781 RepID=A0A8X8C6E6_POPTO|nr:hypothetical protein POTOM_053714 [Populus tomentosa]
MSKREDWFSSFPGFSLVVLQIRFVWRRKIIAVSKRFKDQVLMLDVPMRGVAPLLEAVKKLRTSSEHLTALHPDFLQLCLLGKCYKTGLSILEDDIFEHGALCFLVWVSFAGAGIGAASYWGSSSPLFM